MKSRSLPFLLPFLLLAACSRPDKAPPPFPAPDATPAVQALLDNPTPNIGEPVTLDLRVASDTPHLLPPWEELLDPAIRILSQTRLEDRTRLSIALYSVTNLTVFAQASARSLDEPPLDIPLPFQTLEVTPTLADDAPPLPEFGNDTLPDFRGPEALRRFRRNLLLSLAGLLLVAALVAWLGWHAARRPKPPPPPPDHKRIALRELEALRASDAWNLPDPDASAVRLSNILRAYIEGRFDIHAPDLTTEEFLLAASANPPWGGDDQARLHRVFTRLDRIKFAAERPGRPELDDLLRASEAFIRGNAPIGGEA